MTHKHKHENENTHTNTRTLSLTNFARAEQSRERSGTLAPAIRARHWSAELGAWRARGRASSRRDGAFWGALCARAQLKCDSLRRRAANSSLSFPPAEQLLPSTSTRKRATPAPGDGNKARDGGEPSPLHSTPSYDNLARARRMVCICNSFQVGLPPGCEMS